jgi:hypothetical protein
MFGDCGVHERDALRFEAFVRACLIRTIRRE